ncbi:MAG: alanine racemase [Andreesenia angusta]|nr:alanine racemase [Andreesenia angusta]
MDYRTTWAEIDLDNLSHNLNQIKSAIKPDTRILAVVKANAYGHGSVQIAKQLRDDGVDFFAVSSIYEAIELRENGIKEDILVLGYTPEGHIVEALKYDIILTIYGREFADQISRIAKGMNTIARAHIKVETGMNRLGFQLNTSNLDDIESIYNIDNIEIDGVFTHLASADSKDKSFAKEQYNKFNIFLEELKNRGIDIKNSHISNSAAIIDIPEFNMDLVRPGIMLYGYYPSDEVSREKIKLKKVMTLKTRISNIKTVLEGETIGYSRKYRANRDMVVATMPIGYADGFSRLLSEKISVNYKKFKFNLIGNICMDQSFIDCTENPNIKIGDEIIVFGEGEGINSADDLALAMGTINYEIICLIGRRIPRIFLKNKKKLKTIDYLL